MEKKGNGFILYKKLIQYAIEEQMASIQVIPNVHALNFQNNSLDNALNQSELVKFYKKWDNPEMPFIILEKEFSDD